ncbi:somatostatin-1A-like [Rhinoraja longicauda]
MQTLVAAVCIALLLPRVPAAAGDGPLSELLQELAPDGREEVARMLALGWASGLRRGDGEAAGVERRQAAAVKGTGTESGKKRRRGMRPRNRKAGCKNFFWKTYTSC